MSAIHMAVLLMVAGGPRAPRAFVFNQTISAGMQNYNLRSAAQAAGWNGTDPLIATVTINSGVVVSANSPTQYAFDTGAAPPVGSTLAIVNNGYIVGAPGAAGGPPGGPALRAQAAITITNNGIIGGGGGGGGAVGAAVVGNANITWAATGTRLGSIT